MAYAPVVTPRQALSLAIDATNSATLPPASDTLEFVHGIGSAQRIAELYLDGWTIETGPIAEGIWISYLLTRPLVEVPD